MQLTILAFFCISNFQSRQSSFFVNLIRASSLLPQYVYFKNSLLHLQSCRIDLHIRTVLTEVIILSVQ